MTTNSHGIGAEARARLRILLRLLVLLALVMFAGGCKSKEPAPEAKFPTIHGNTPGQIAPVVVDVFVQNGFVATGKRSEKLVFEKKAGQLDSIAYGNWIGDVPVYRRVKVTIVPAGEATYELHCSVYSVRDKGGATEEEVKTISGPEKKLLAEVASRFKK